MTKVVGSNQIARQKLQREVEHFESAGKSDPVLHLMTSLAGYLQDLVLASSWSVLWRGGQAWRTRIDGPALQDVKGEEQEELLAEKLAFCSVALNFAESPEEDRDRKTATLEELLDFIRQNFPTLSRALICDLVEMVTANIFRPLPNLQMTDGVDPLDEEEEWQDPSWPHLSLAYTILLTLLEHQHFEPNSLKTVVNKPFIEKLLGLFFSADAGERETLKTVLHRIYGNFISLRRIIRVRVSELLLSVIHEGADLPGAAQLLEVLSAVLQGVKLPLKEEHVEMVERVLVPLHRVGSYHGFSAQLTHCCSQLVVRQPSLAAPIYQGLLRYWPTTDSTKQLLFLEEIDRLLIGCKPPPSLLTPLRRKMLICSSSPHSRVAERALHLWLGPARCILQEASPSVRANLLDHLLRNICGHWSPLVVALSEEVSEVVLGMIAEEKRKKSSPINNNNNNGKINNRNYIKSSSTQHEQEEQKENLGKDQNEPVVFQIGDGVHPE